MPNLNEIRPAVPKLQPIEIWPQKNLQITLLQLEAEPMELDQSNFGSKNLEVVSNISLYQKVVKGARRWDKRGGSIDPPPGHMSWPGGPGQVGLIVY